MLKTIVTLALALTSAPNVEPAPAANAALASLDVTITGLESSSGKVVILLYTSADGFPTKPSKAKKAFYVNISGKSASRTIKLAPGTYALSVYHDANSNGELDTNWLGIPKEGLGASNNAKGRMGPPKFSAARFTLGADGGSQNIKLMYL